MKPVTEFSPESPASRALSSLMDVEQRIRRNVDRWRVLYKPSKPSGYKPILIRPEGLE
jgi:hypothetical protein